MRRYDAVERKLVSVKCNGCGRDLRVEKGMILEEALHVEKQWGYFSGKDGRRHVFDLCEDCLDRWMSGFVIPAEETEVTELI